MTPTGVPADGPDGEAAIDGAPGQAVIDRESCMGSGNRLFWAPGVFDLVDDGIALVRGDLAVNGERVRLAADNCPTRATRVDASMFHG